MIFSCSIGSKGEKEESFSIIFPFVLSPGKKLNIENICAFQMSDGQRYTLEKHHYLYSLKVERFLTLDAAHNYSVTKMGFVKKQTWDTIPSRNSRTKNV